MEDLPDSRSSFQRTLRDLEQNFDRRSDNPGSHELSDCVRCINCMFTEESRDCVGCTYCTACRDCHSCTKCEACESCFDCAHCTQCERCTESSHLIWCRRCLNCEFCVGCVGLVDAEFCILNKQYSREEYFDHLEVLEERLQL